MPGGATAGQRPSEVSPVVVVTIALREDSGVGLFRGGGHSLLPSEPLCPAHHAHSTLHYVNLISVVLFCGVTAQLGCSVRKQAEACSAFYWILLAWLED